MVYLQMRESCGDVHDGGYDCYYGRGFDCIVPAVSGEYDSELAMRKDIAERNVAAAAAFLAKEILGNPQ